jgi:stage V sporulation protein SpoVS
LSFRISFPAAFWIFLRQGSNSASAKEILAKSLLRQPTEQYIWLCGLISHRLKAAVQASSEGAISDCLDALEFIARQAVGTPEVGEIKQALFGDLEVTRSLMTESGWAVRTSSHLSKVVGQRF